MTTALLVIAGLVVWSVLVGYVTLWVFSARLRKDTFPRDFSELQKQQKIQEDISNDRNRFGNLSDYVDRRR